jgi:hypothetical protein
VLLLAPGSAVPLHGGRKKVKPAAAVPAEPSHPILKYKVVNSHKVKPGADLSWADLSFCDLTGADLHPFFGLPHHEQVGDLAFLRTRVPEDPGPGRVPSALACSADGILFWLSGPGTPLRLISPTGARFLFTEGLEEVVALAKDTHERLWCFGPKGIRVLDLRALARARSYCGFPCHSYGFPVKEPPAALAPGVKGGVWVTLPPVLVGLSLSKKHVLVCDHWDVGPEIMTSPRTASCCAACRSWTASANRWRCARGPTATCGTPTPPPDGSGGSRRAGR